MQESMERRPGTSPEPTLVVDDEGVTRHLGDGEYERVRWDALVRVEILTTSDGPWMEDVYWVLHGLDGNGCVVPGGRVEEVGLLGRLQQLPGFDNQAVIRAMGCTDDERFVCWSRPAGGDGR